MRIVVLSVNHVYANKVVKDLIKEFGKEIVLIIEPSGLLPKKSLLASLKKILKICGFEYVFYQSAKILLFRGIGSFYTYISPQNYTGKFFLMEKLAKLRMIDIIRVRDVNDRGTLKLITNKKPDLIVSVFFNQILDEKTIKISKLGAINIHPGYLPQYKGTSPVYWALVNGEKFVGVSIHKIDKGVDTGPIYKRVRIKVETQDTEDSLYWKCVKEGSGSLIDIIKQIKKGKLKELKNRGGKFYSFPAKESIKKFKGNNRRFLNLQDYLFSD